MANDQAPVAPLFMLVITSSPDGRLSYTLSNRAPELTLHELGRQIVMVGAGFLQQRNALVQTDAQRDAAQRVADVTRDYPAQVWYPEAKAALCVACVDLYAGMLQGPGVPMPPGPPQPCTYHLDPSKAPMPFAEAAQLTPPDYDGELIAQDADLAPGVD